MVRRNALRNPTADPEQPYIPDEPTTEFIIEHNYGFPPLVIVLDDDGFQMFCDVQHDATFNVVTLSFGAAMQPRVWLR